jgi:hypothetical protein
MKRTTISLTEQQQRAIAELMQDESPLEAALREVVDRLGLPERPRTESGVVRMLIDFGWRQINEVNLELGYEEMAEWYNNDSERKAIRRERRRRRAERLSQEERAEQEVDA